MPCYDGDPNNRDSRGREVAAMLRFALEQAGRKVPRYVGRWASGGMETTGALDVVTSQLCKLLRGMDATERARILEAPYPIAKKLKKWWRDHQRFDAERGDG